MFPSPKFRWRPDCEIEFKSIGRIKQKAPGEPGAFDRDATAAGYSAGDGFFLNIAMRLSHSSILAPWRFMMTPCWMIDSVLFQAQ